MKIDNEILSRYSQGKCTEAEQLLVESWFDKQNRSFSDGELDDIVSSLDKKLKKSTVRQTVFRWSAIAAVFVAIFFAFYYYQVITPTRLKQYAVLKEIKAPISSNAVLIFEDKSEYKLDDIIQGDTVDVNGYLLTKLSTGELSYITPANTVLESVHHTLRTNKGGIASVQLSDGSKVWINSASEISYPVHFANKREVSLKGEGFFEIHKTEVGNVKQPFFVYGEKQTIQVLGTKFNADFVDKNRIALLEGKISLAVNNDGDKLQDNLLVMVPGQLYENGHVINTPEIERYIDWKEGFFDLRKLNIYDLADELSAWYGITVQVESGLPRHALFGRIDRRRDLIVVLQLLSKALPVSYELKDNVVLIKKAV